MSCRICALFISVLRATAQQGAVEMIVDAQGDVDATVMLQTQGPHVQMATQYAKETGLAELHNATAESTKTSRFDAKAYFAEYIAMTLFVMIGCGSAMGSAKEPGWVLLVALSFGFAIASLAYAIGHYSGGQINCAVTLGLLLTGHLSASQAIFNFMAQMLGSITGAALLTAITPQDSDKTGGLGVNKVDEKYSLVNALAGEAAMTFLLMFVVLETAINPASESNRALACLAIGFAVFLAHSVLIPIDGCSINPTRSFGPALVSKILYKDCDDSFKNHWVFWLGPLGGAAGAALMYTGFAAWE